MDFFSEAKNIVGISTILGTIAAWIALYPIIKPYLLKITGKIIPPNEFERSYLISLEKDLETKNQNNRWSNKFYVDVEVELQMKKKLYDIPPSYYVIKTINRHLKIQDFNNLSNVEKIDSSRGQSFNSLQSAINESQDNSVVVISPPGNGKTVSLRNLAIKNIHQRLSKQINKTPIFINLGYYTGFNEDGTIQDFTNFLEGFFSSTGYYRYLADHHWETLLRQSRCIFFLDGIDELPRTPKEYETRSKKIVEFVQSWPNTQFILSCRELDYNQEFSLQQILIKPFNKKHIHQYLRRYLPKKQLRIITHQMDESTEIFELCTNPFYLDLVSYFSKFNNKIPDNKAQLFSFIIDKFIERENLKLDILIKRENFILAMSNLAYYLGITKMTTTTCLDDYMIAIKKLPNKQIISEMINYAIEGGILEFNQQNHEIRFIHNRFQEFFSSHYLLRSYRKGNNIFPKNFFTNIWWKETVLFIAGLDDNVEDFITLIINYRNDFLVSDSFIGNLLKVDVTCLAYECIFASLGFHNDNLYGKIRDDLFQEYNLGNTLIKAKVLNAFRHDKTERVAAFLKTAIDDKSLWISERAFFLLTDEQIKFQLTTKGILKEFLKFFSEGRLINIFIPLWKSFTKSRLIRIFFPFYLLLLIVSILSISLIGYIYYSLIKFVIFDLDFAFTTECLSCLFTVSVGIFIVTYALTKNNYPLLKRFIYTTPLALMIHYLIFNIPNNYFYKLIMVALGFLFNSLYETHIKKPNEFKYSIGSITASILGFTIPVPFFNFKSFSKLFDSNLFNPERWVYFNDIKIIFDKIQPYLLSSFLFISMLVLCIYIYKEIQVVKKLNNLINFVQKQLSISFFNNKENVLFLLQKLESLSIIWAQEILLKKIIDKITNELNFTRINKIALLNFFAQKTTNVYLSDKIFQYIETEQNNLRRAIV